MVAIAIVATLLLVWAVSRQSGPIPWNVVIVTIDTTRADHLGCYGNSRAQTPTLDRLAAEGVRYEACYAPAPLTLPSHCTIMTGLYPFSHGVHDNGEQLDLAATTLAEVLSDRGYRTGAAVGAFVLDRRFSLDQGFASYDDGMSAGQPETSLTFAERHAGHVTDSALEFLAKEQKRAYFLWVHYFDPHAPYAAPGYDPQVSSISAYEAEISYADKHLDRLIKAIDADKKRQTLLIVTSDHGEGLMEHGELSHGTFIYNSTMRVPLIIRKPELNPAGAVVDVPVTLADVFPSVLAWLGIKEVGDVHGQVLPLANPDVKESRLIYLENYGAANRYGWSKLSGAVRGHDKLIDAPTPELYDLEKDRHEQHNLLPDQEAVAQEIDEALKAFLQERPDHFQNSQSLVDLQTMRRLAALGYLGHGSTGTVQEGADPKDMITLLPAIYLCQTLIEQGRNSEAADRLASILRERDPSNLRCLWLLASICPDTKVGTSVVDLLGELAAKPFPSPLNFILPAKLGQALAARDRDEEAVVAFRSALAADDKQAAVHIHLASALERLGHQPQAWLDEFETACALEPDNEDFARILKEANKRAEMQLESQ